MKCWCYEEKPWKNSNYSYHENEALADPSLRHLFFQITESLSIYTSNSGTLFAVSGRIQWTMSVDFYWTPHHGPNSWDTRGPNRSAWNLSRTKAITVYQSSRIIQYMKPKIHTTVFIKSEWGGPRPFRGCRIGDSIPTYRMITTETFVIV